MNANNRPKLSFFKTARNGLDMKLTFEFNPATTEADGCLIMSISLAKGDDSNHVAVCLTFDDICKFMQVFRGECENINDGKGIRHWSPSHQSIVKLCHKIDYTYGMYDIEVTMIDDDIVVSRKISLTSAEALGLCTVFEHTLSLVAFGEQLVK